MKYSIFFATFLFFGLVFGAFLMSANSNSSVAAATVPISTEIQEESKSVQIRSIQKKISATVPISTSMRAYLV